MLAHAVVSPLEGSRMIRFLSAYRLSHEEMRGAPRRSDLVEHQRDLACQKSNVTAAEAKEYLSRWFENEPLRHLALLRDATVRETLHRAKRKGLALGVLSDYPAFAKLKALGLDSYFDAVLSSSDPEIGCLKPNPLGLFAVLKLLGVTPESTVYIGDRPDVDAVCAHAAGVHAIIIRRRMGKGDGVTGLRDYRELDELLTRKQIL